MICCIAGMHRSGTSLVAQWLAAAGVPLVTGGDIAPDISNPRGYIEDLDFVRLHAAHLRRTRRWSFGWNYAPGDFLHFDAVEADRGRRMVARRDALHATWGWKDPRTTLFLTDWKKLIPTLKVVFVWRPCADVVASLLNRGLQQRRAHLLISPLGAIRLWRTYNHLGCSYQARHPDDTLFIAAARLPATSPQVHTELAERFGLVVAPSLTDGLFDPDLVHRAPAWIQTLCRTGGCSSLEARLQALSAGAG